MRKLLFVLLVTVVPSVTAFGVLWSHYPSTGQAEDRVGVGLNSLMPKSVRLWACDKALERDKAAFRPVGCW